jgi:tetratricopeptide (TPR) repeat protein
MKIAAILFVSLSWTLHAQTLTSQIIEEAITRLNHGELSQAKTLLRQAYQTDSENKETLYYLSETYYKLGEHDSSEYFLEAMNSHYDPDHKYFMLKGRIDMAEYHHEIAIEAFEKCVKYCENPSSKAEAYSLMALSKSEMGLPDEAIGDINEALKLDEQPSYYYHRARFNYQKGRTNKAIRDFDRVIKLNNQHSAAYFWRGIAKHSLMQSEEGCNDLIQAEALREPNAREMRARLCQ